MRDRHVGLLVEDPRIELWTAESSGTQAGPRAGVPEPSQTSSMALAATGTQPASSAGVEVMTRQSGYPVRAATVDSVDALIHEHGAKFVWRAVGGSSTSWRGWDPPRYIADWHAAVWTDASGNLQSVTDPVITTAQNGDLLVIAQVRETSASGGEYRLECIRRTAASSTWTRVLIEGEASAPSQNYCPAVVVLPSGRVLVYRWLRQATGSTMNGLRLWYSDDAGLTWSYGGDGVAGRGTSSTITRTRACFAGQQIVVMALTSTGNIEQYASSDLGNAYTYVGLADATNAYVSFDLAATDDGFVIAYVGGDTSTTGTYVRLFANAFEIFEAATESASILTAGVTGEVAIVADDTGYLYLVGRLSGASNDLYALLSGDNGANWKAYNDSPSYLFTSGDTGTHLDTLSMTWWRGQAVMAHQWVAAPGDEDDSLGVAYLGGYTSVTMPRHRAHLHQSGTAGWNRSWLPLDLPGDTGWTAAGTAATEALETGAALRLNTTSANTRTYTQTAIGTLAQGVLLLLDFAAVSGGATTTNQRGARIIVSNGANSYQVEVRIGTAGWRLYDGISAAIIGSEQVASTLVYTQILVAVQNNDVSTWWRTTDTTVGGSRSWTVGPTSTALTDGGVVAAGITVAWGHRATGGTAVETLWRHVSYSSGDFVGRNIALGLTNPTDLQGRLYAWRDRGVYVYDEVAIQARSGPTVLGEAWQIATAYDYGRARTLEPQPRRAWRSTTIAATERIAYRWATAGDSPFASPVLGVYIGNKNISRITVDFYDLDTTSWVNSTVYDLHTDLAYTRVGDSVTSSGSGVAIPIKHGEYVGGSFALSGTVAREIAHHGEGFWQTGSGVKSAVLQLAGALVGDSASGTGALIPRQAVILLDLAGTRYSGIRISHAATDATNPPGFEGYFTVGRILVGPVFVMADDPEWGRAIEVQHGAEVAEFRDRSTASRVAAPTRRVVEIAWTEGIDTTGIEAATPGEVVYAMGQAAARVGGTPSVLDGIARMLDGGARQVVYLPRITGSPQVLQRRDEMVLARLDGPVRIETVQGDELEDEVVRVMSLTLREDV